MSSTARAAWKTATDWTAPSANSIRSVAAMQPPQRFQVIFYNDRATPMPGDLPKTADYSSRTTLARFLNRIDADGGTDPRDALNLALAMRPDAVFLLSDGAFPDGTAAAVAALNRHKTPIHCVDLAGGTGGDDLKTIARESGGPVFRLRTLTRADPQRPPSVHGTGRNQRIRATIRQQISISIAPPRGSLSGCP